MSPACKLNIPSVEHLFGIKPVEQVKYIDHNGKAYSETIPYDPNTGDSVKTFKVGDSFEVTGNASGSSPGSYPPFLTVRYFKYPESLPAVKMVLLSPGNVMNVNFVKELFHIATLKTLRDGNEFFVAHDEKGMSFMTFEPSQIVDITGEPTATNIYGGAINQKRGTTLNASNAVRVRCADKTHITSTSRDQRINIQTIKKTFKIKTCEAVMGAKRIPLKYDRKTGLSMTQFRRVQDLEVTGEPQEECDNNNNQNSALSPLLAANATLEDDVETFINFKKVYFPVSMDSSRRQLESLKETWTKCCQRESGASVTTQATSESSSSSASKKKNKQKKKKK